MFASDDFTVLIFALLTVLSNLLCNNVIPISCNRANELSGHGSESKSIENLEHRLTDIGSKLAQLETRFDTVRLAVDGLKQLLKAVEASASKHKSQCGHSRASLSSNVIQKPLPSPPPPSSSLSRQLSRRSLSQLPADRLLAQQARGLDGLPGLDGAPGLDGIPGANGRDGRDGTNGRDGKDGKDGLPGERGRPGPAGPAGKPGRRGERGPPGRMGPAGPAGVCAYRAQVDCSNSGLKFAASPSSSSSPSPNGSSIGPLTDAAWLMAPTMIGGYRASAKSASQDIHLDGQRQVSVNEGDNIQLSCEAFGLPPPVYVWRRLKVTGSYQRRREPADDYNNEEEKNTPDDGDGNAAVDDNNDQVVDNNSARRRNKIATTDNTASNNNNLAARDNRNDATASVILLDPASDLKVSSFSGGQLPLANVDRLQAGVYECIASNGIEPSASKQITLDVNYAPTVRLFPVGTDTKSTFLRRPIKLGSSLSVECLLESNPAPIGYWTLNSELLMSINGLEGTFATTTLAQELGHPISKKGSATKENRGKYVITESVGQLSTGASYTILTLQIERLEATDLGEYKCVGRNLVGQASGRFVLVDQAKETGTKMSQQVDDEPVIESLDHSLGWPTYLLDRDEPLYATFGQPRRRAKQPIEPLSWPTTMQSQSTNVPIERPKDNDARRNELNVATTPESSTDQTSIHAATSFTSTTPSSVRKVDGGIDNELDVGEDEYDNEDEDSDQPLCRVLVAPNPNETPTSSNQTSSGRPLDRLGRPVYLSSSKTIIGELDWWSQDSQLQRDEEQSYQQMQIGPHYVTMVNNRNELLEYANLSELLHDLKDQSATNSTTSTQRQRGHWRRRHKLRYPIANTRSLLVHGGYVYYIGLLRARPSDWNLTTGELKFDDLVIVAEQLESSAQVERKRFELRLIEKMQESDLLDGGRRKGNLSSSSSWRKLRLLNQLTDLIPNQADQIDLASDESGVWLIVPTIELVHRGDSIKQESEVVESEPTSTSASSLQVQFSSPTKRRARVIKSRRLHVAKLKLTQSTSNVYSSLVDGNSYLYDSDTSFKRQETTHTITSDTSPNLTEEVQPQPPIERDRNNNDTIGDSGNSTTMRNSNLGKIDLSYHISMKLDWQMIGQLFIIDGVLYGVKDRHSYSSKLQFAYDLYKCKLLPTEYLNEPQRTFTSHFGGTQIIKYNPNEPKRLYTIDNGNLLWCPVKLLEQSVS